MLQYEAIKKVKDYSEIIDSTRAIVNKAKEKEKKSIVIKKYEEQLAKEQPALTREELDEPGKINCLKRIEKLEIAQRIKGYDAVKRQLIGLYTETS